MSSDRRNLVIAIVAVAVVTVILLLWPSVEESLAPEFRAAWVAIEVDGSGEAVVGTLALEAGMPFQLHAVLEAEARDGSRVFYTEAPALILPDGPVSAESLRRWDRPQEARVLWFTVEGSVPFLELKEGDGLDRFRLTEFLRPDWPQAWSIPGDLSPANDDALVRSGARGDNPFGTQRFHVRVELFGPESQLVPQERYTSWAADEVRERGEEFPGVVVSQPGLLGPPSTLFGLTQIEPPKPTPDAASTTSSMLPALRRLTDDHLAFSRVTALGALLRGADLTTDRLVWTQISLDAGLPWGDEGVAPGDVLRVGDRAVILYRDRREGEMLSPGEPGPDGAPPETVAAGGVGSLDRQDLCFDYARGATVRPLGDVFVGGGQVEHADLSSISDAPGL